MAPNFMKRQEFQRQLKSFEKQKRVNKLAKPGPHRFTLVLDHLKRDFNVGKIIRSSDAFGAEAVYLVGVPFFDPTPAKGSFKHVPVRFFDNFDDCYAALQQEGKAVYALDIVNAKSLLETRFAENTAIIVGHEEFGLSFDLTKYPEIQVVYIPQFGKVESLNVSVAATVAMYEYVRQINGGQKHEIDSI